MNHNYLLLSHIFYEIAFFLSFFLLTARKCLGFTYFFFKLLVQRRDKMYTTITKTEHTIYRLKKRKIRRITGIVAA